MREILKLPHDILAEWMAYEKLEPFGPVAQWQQAAMLACILANAHRSKRSKKFKPEDFLPKEMFFKPQTMADMIEAAKSIAAASKEREAVKARRDARQKERNATRAAQVVTPKPQRGRPKTGT